MPELDNLTSQYTKGAVTEIENELILNWYPDRILAKICNDKPNSLLELGIGHGFTTCKFSKFFKRHEVIEGSQKVIDMFKREYPQNTSTIVHSF